MAAVRLIFLALVALCISGCGTGIPPAGNYATVSGRVVDAASGAGIASAVVAVNGGTEQATSDGSGNFRITTVPTGDWDYTASAPNYQTLPLVTNPAPLGPGEQRSLTITLTHT